MALKSKVDIRREIEKVSSSYKDDEIFSSQYFFDILYSIVNGACLELGEEIDLDAFCNPKDNTTACTEGSCVTINTLGPLIREVPTVWGKYVNNVGHCVHEASHILFTDFETMNERYKCWKSDKTEFYGGKPIVEGIDVDAQLEYLDSHPNYKKMYIKSMESLDNVMEDVFVENCAYDKFAGVATLGLQRSRDELYRTSDNKEKIYQDVLDDKITPLDAFITLLLIKRTGYELKTNNSITPEQQKVEYDLFDAFDRCEEEIDALKWEHKGKRRNELLNKLFAKLQYLLPEKDDKEYANPTEAIKKFLDSLSDEIRKKLEEQSSSDEGEGSPMPMPFGSSHSSSSSDYSDEEAESKMEEADKTMKKNGKSADPSGEDRPKITSKPNKAKSEAAQKEAADMSDETCKHELEKAKKEMATAQVLENDEKNHSAELQSEADEIAENESNEKGNSFFDGYSIQRESTRQAAKYDVAGYMNIFKEVEKTSNMLAKKLSNILNQYKEEESCSSGYLMGNVFNARDVYHNDGKYFSRINEPDGKLRIAFSILVDNSGSMYGKKTEIARKATILIENTLRKLNVPFMIAGHTEYSGECTIYPYCDFDSNDGMDRYRLYGIQAESGNIDGAAITYMGDKLLKRPEEIKILIVISDGLPAGSSFYSHISNDDTKLAVENYRKKGVKVFGAVVDCFELVSNIYGSEYSFDARGQEALSKTLTQIVKKEMMRTR